MRDVLAVWQGQEKRARSQNHLGKGNFPALAGGNGCLLKIAHHAPCCLGQIDLFDMGAPPPAGEIATDSDGEEHELPRRPFRYVMQARDHFSKYVYLEPMITKTADEAATTLERVIAYAGVPRIIHSDNGGEFEYAPVQFLSSHLTVNRAGVEEVCEMYEIEHVRGRARHPQSQGGVETSNGNVKAKMRKHLFQHEGRTWVQALRYVNGDRMRVCQSALLHQLCSIHQRDDQLPDEAHALRRHVRAASQLACSAEQLVESGRR